MMAQSIIQPKIPNNPAWIARGGLNHGYPNCAFFHPKLGILAISAVEVPDDEPEYHLSISMSGKNRPRRCAMQQALMVVKQFGMEGALEDNHSPLFIRSFWMPVAKSKQEIETLKDIEDIEEIQRKTEANIKATEEIQRKTEANIKATKVYSAITIVLSVVTLIVLVIGATK